nr:M13 family metallopeptidase [uncultured Sphingomonas sp.]
MTTNRTPVRLIAMLLAGAALPLGLAACKMGSADNEVAAAANVSGINVAGMDKSVKPGDDFYNYANGNWQKTTEIPADRSSVGGFYTAFLETEKNNKVLIADALKDNVDPATDQGRLAAYYKAFLDTVGIDKAGLGPVKPDLDKYQAIADKGALSEVLGANVRADVDPLNATNFHTENLFGVFVTQGLSTPGEQVPYLLQGGLGLPERDYYLSTDGKMGEIRGAYKPYIEKMFTLAGYPDAAARAQRVYDLEMKIAGAHATREESEDFAKGATIWTRADFDSKAPGIDWTRFLTAASLNNSPKFEAYHSGAIPKLSALVASEPLDSWKDWLVFHRLNEDAAVLPKAFRDASFAFNDQLLAGKKEMAARDRDALASVNANMGDALGKAYADKYFPASSKTEIQSMVDGIKTAFATRVKGLDWMAQPTKDEAVKKVEGITVGIGYPDSWRDYSAMPLSPTNAYANLEAAKLAEYKHQLAKIGQPMDRAEWWMNPQTVNAVNLPVSNSLNFPAGILQPPFYVANADPAYNYGAIGAVIGHEISHSFDNNGALFDSSGALRNWWTPADFAKFQQSGKALADQYSSYEALPGLKVKGDLTLGENIADVAGLQAAYDAYHASLNGKEAPVIDGLTGDQRFFIAYAQTWQTKMRDEALRARIATDGHAPGNFRALTVRNIDAWYKAFDVKPGDKLYLPPEKRVKVW